MKVTFIKTLEQYIEIDMPDDSTVEDLNNRYNFIDWVDVPVEYAFAKCIDKKGNELWES